MKAAKKKAEPRVSAKRFMGVVAGYQKINEDLAVRVSEEQQGRIDAEQKRDELLLQAQDRALEIRSLKADVEQQRRKAACEAWRRAGAIGALRMVIADLTVEAIRRALDEERGIRDAESLRRMTESAEAYRKNKNVDTPGGRS